MFYDYDNHLFELHTGTLSERLKSYDEYIEAIKSDKKMLDDFVTYLTINVYSRGQFDETAEGITVDEDFMAKAGSDDYCFAENISVKPYEKEMQKIILYRWNRVYPADLYFDIDLKNWHLKESNDFAGSSHDKITEEIYVK